MSTTIKKVVLGVVALALVAVIGASVASAASYNFASSLTVGSKGADVTALQNILIQKGNLNIAAPTGYFGGLTKAAVKLYQSANSIPSTGFVGPLTRGALNKEGAVATTGGTTTTTGGTTTTTGSTSGVEGTLDTRLASTPSDNSNIRTQTNVPVYGIEFRARIADVSVQTLDLQVSVVGTGSENPATLINTINVLDGSNVLATIPVNTTTFVKDQNQVYYIRLSGLNFNVPKDVTKVLTVTFSTNSIDTDRVVTIQGYNSSSVRAVSGTGVSSFYGINGSGYTRTHTFKKPGTSTLTLSSAAQTLRSANYRVNGNDTLQGVVLAQFNLKSQTGESTLLTVNASTTASGTMPSTIYLYQGSTLLKSMSVPSNGSVSFNNLDSAAGAVVAQSETPTTFTIKADFPSNTNNGTYASTTIQSVVYQTPAGNSSNASGSAVANANQYIYTKAAVITLAGTPTISAQNAAVSPGTSTVTAVFPLNIQALGGNVILPVNGDVTVTFSNGVSATVANTVVVTIPNNDIGDGSSANVTVTAKSAGFAPGLYNAAITQIKWNAGNGTTTQTYGFDDFKTSAAANQQ